MSYDLMVFNKESAPKNRKDFMVWYNKQTKWFKNHNCQDITVTSPELYNWFMEMIKTFSTVYRPSSGEKYNTLVSDYSIGKEVIYIGFSWSVAEIAYVKAIELAEKYSVGFFDVSSHFGHIFIPEDGLLMPIV